VNWKQNTCPECGEQVAGTVEEVQGMAKLVSDGEGGFEYEGTTQIWWDTQKSMQGIGGDILTCKNYHIWESEKTT